MRFVFFKNITCENSIECSQNIHKRLEKIYPDLKQGINYHVSISHEQTNHKIWLFVYDKDLQHESEARGEIVYTHSETVKKYSGQPINLSIDAW
jgi:ribosome-associated translation inhibitor RaiA